MTQKKKRFIAGAICPQCKQMDKLIAWREEGIDYRECVNCEFQDTMQFKPQLRELETRVNITEEEKKSQVQVLNFPKEE